MEAVGIVFSIGHALNHAVLFTIQPHKPTAQALGRRGQACEIQTVFLAAPIAEISNITNDFQPKRLCLVAFSVMRPAKCLKGLCKPNKAY